MAEFYLGQPVLCINGKPFAGAHRDFPGIMWPIEGKVYRIRAVYAPIETRVSQHRFEMLTFVLLHGLRNTDIMWGNGKIYEAAFWEARFVPATDIDSLRSINENIDRFMGDNGPRVDKKIKTKRRKKEKVW